MYARIISLKKILSEIDVDIWKRNFHIEQSEKKDIGSKAGNGGEGAAKSQGR